MLRLVRRRRRTCDPPTCNRNRSANIQRLFTSFWELTMISRFHVYRYANCMLLYNISTLHHRDDRSFSRINFNDASLVGLPAPSHRSFQGTRVRLCPCINEQISLPQTSAVPDQYGLNRRRISDLHRYFAAVRPVLPPDDGARCDRRTRLISRCS